MGDGRLGAGDCERLRPTRLVQPVNAVTSGAYCAAGWVVAVRCWAGAGDRQPEVVLFATLLELVGVGSIAFHGPQVPGSRAAHDWPIPALVGVVAASPLMRRRRGRRAFPGWTRARGAWLVATAATAGAAYAAGRTRSPTCHPESPIQLHGAWHLLSAAAFVQVGDILYQEG